MEEVSIESLRALDIAVRKVEASLSSISTEMSRFLDDQKVYMAIFENWDRIFSEAADDRPTDSEKPKSTAE